MSIENGIHHEGDGQSGNGPILDDHPAYPTLATDRLASIFPSHPDPGPRQRASKGRPTWDRDTVLQAVLNNLDVVLDHLDIRQTGVVTNRGWLECHAFDRDDATPSAGIESETGIYNDLGSERKPLSIFDLAIETGRFTNFNEAVNGLGQLLGVPPKVGSPSRSGAATRRETPLRGGPDGKKEISRVASGKSKAIFPDVNEIAGHLARILKGQGLRDIQLVIYPYTKAFHVIRCDGRDSQGKKRKEIRPIHRLGPDQWVYGDPPGLLPLCNLGNLTDSSPVLIVEGERCVETLIEIGFPNATTSAHGAESARKSDWSRLPGRRFVILPDNDAGGKRYAADVARILTSNRPGAEVRIVRLAGLAEGEDIVDWVAKGGTAEKLTRLIADAPTIDGTEAEDRQKGRM
jgi:hypothetical protein